MLFDNYHEYRNLFADRIRKENSLGGTLEMYTTLIIPSLVKAVRYRLPARRETRPAHNGQWRTIASFAARCVARCAPKQEGKSRMYRVCGQVRCQVTYRDTPRVRALRFAIADVRPVFSFCHNGATDSPERVQRSSYSRLKYREASGR